MESWLPGVVGIVAGICSTTSFVPQVVKVWRDGDTHAISKKMYLVTVAAFSLWTVYGVMIGSMPIVVFNILSLFLSASILAAKLRHRRRRA